MSRHLRIAHVAVLPVLVWDDGENLAPGPTVQPIQVGLADLPGLADRLPVELAAYEASEGQQS